MRWWIYITLLQYILKMSYFANTWYCNYMIRSLLQIKIIPMSFVCEALLLQIGSLWLLQELLFPAVKKWIGNLILSFLNILRSKFSRINNYISLVKIVWIYNKPKWNHFTVYSTQLINIIYVPIQKRTYRNRTQNMFS